MMVTRFIILISLFPLATANGLLNNLAQIGDQMNVAANSLRTSQIPGIGLPPSGVFSHKTNAKWILNYIEPGVNLFRYSLSRGLVTVKMRGADNISIKNTPKPNTEMITEFQKAYNNLIRGATPEGYDSFGNGCTNVEKLEEFLSCNPFYVSALSYSTQNGFYIDSVWGQRDDDAAEGMYLPITNVLDEKYPRVNAKFSDNLKLTSFEVLTKSGNPWPVEKTKEEAAGDLLFLMSYYFEIFHAALHLFHWIMICGIIKATNKYKELDAWADIYQPNIPVKTAEVSIALFNTKTGLLTSSQHGFFKVSDEAHAEGQVLFIVRGMVESWCGCKSADDFNDKVLMKSIGIKGLRIIAKKGHLSEYMKQKGLISGYAREVCSAFQAHNPQEMDRSNAKFASVMCAFVGITIEVSEIREFIELMSVTGILHGCSISACRSVICGELLSRFSPESETYGAHDQILLNTLGCTGLGLAEDRHVFSGTRKNKKEIEKVANLKEIMVKYDYRSSIYKKQYHDACVKDPNFLTKFGWCVGVSAIVHH